MVDIAWHVKCCASHILPTMAQYSPTTNAPNMHTHYQMHMTHTTTMQQLKPSYLLQPLHNCWWMLLLYDMSSKTSHCSTSWLNGHKPYQLISQYSETLASPFALHKPVDAFIKCSIPAPTMAHLPVDSTTVSPTVKGPPPLLMANSNWTVDYLIWTRDRTICTVQNVSQVLHKVTEVAVTLENKLLALAIAGKDSHDCQTTPVHLCTTTFSCPQLLLPSTYPAPLLLDYTMLLATHTTNFHLMGLATMFASTSCTFTHNFWPP